MNPYNPLPAGTPEHREHFAKMARRRAFTLAGAIGSGEIGREVYRGLPVGARRCQRALQELLNMTENKALELFDMAVAVRDLPAAHNVVTMKRRKV